MNRTWTALECISLYKSMTIEHSPSFQITHCVLCSPLCVFLSFSFFFVCVYVCLYVCVCVGTLNVLPPTKQKQTKQTKKTKTKTDRDHEVVSVLVGPSSRNTESASRLIKNWRASPSLLIVKACLCVLHRRKVHLH